MAVTIFIVLVSGVLLTLIYSCLAVSGEESRREEQKEMEDYMSTYHSEDITFCTSPCSRTSCYRHKSNIRDQNREHTVADLKGTVYCQLPPERPTPARRRGRKHRI